MGIDSRELTPKVVEDVVQLSAELRSYAAVAKVLRQTRGWSISAKTVERVVQEVGRELAQRRDAGRGRAGGLAHRPETPPELAVVQCDGGRIRTRQMGQGTGVHTSGGGWRETKNACLVRARRRVFSADPQPEPPQSLCDRRHVQRLVQGESATSRDAPAEKLAEGASGTPLPDAAAEQSTRAAAVPCEEVCWQPQSVLRTVLSSIVDSQRFGRQMGREARQRRFDEAAGRVFVGDGLPWNWSIWEKHFPEYTPILDFMHVLRYLYAAAIAIHGEGEGGWEQYVVWMRGCWGGEVVQVIEELGRWQARLGDPPEGAEDTDPRSVVRRARSYLDNNQQRMRYPEYRRQGFPITTAWMESVVKQINHRVKGSEMHWNDPEGAEAILQVRAAALCEDGRLQRHLRTRPGCPFIRRPKTSHPRQTKNKS